MKAKELSAAEKEAIKQERMAQRLFGSGQLDLGLRADLARLTSLAARDESGESQAAARDALNRASPLAPAWQLPPRTCPIWQLPPR